MSTSKDREALPNLDWLSAAEKGDLIRTLMTKIAECEADILERMQRAHALVGSKPCNSGATRPGCL
jgi:hypothetical protein